MEIGSPKTGMGFIHWVGIGLVAGTVTLLASYFFGAYLPSNVSSHLS